MELQGRNLQLGIEGEDVVLLQQELRLLRFTIDDRKGYFGRDTRDAVMQFQQQHGLDATGEVDEHTASFINEALHEERFIVRGQVRLENGIPFRDGIVRAFHQGFRTDKTELGEAIPNLEGNYEIAYQASLLQNLGRERANLFVCVYHQDNEEPIATSEESILFNAEPEAAIDLYVEPEHYRETAKFDRIDRQLGKLPLTEITEEEIPYLAAETNLERQDVEVMVQAAKVAKTIKDSYKLEVKPKIFYALASEDIAITSLTDVVSQEQHVLRHALETSLSKNTIRDERETEALIDDTLSEFLKVAVTERLNENLGQLLRTSPRLAEKDGRQQAFIRESLTYDGEPDGFWEHLSQQPEFAPEFPEEKPIQDLQFTLELGKLTQDHLPLVEVLQGELRKDDNPPTLRHLASWKVQDWRDQLHLHRTGTPSSIPGEDEKTRVNNYADLLFQTIEDKYPTAVIAHRLSEDEEQEHLPGAQELLQIFDHDQDFDLGRQNIDLYLGQEAVAEEKAHLKSLQRAYRLSPSRDRYDVMRTLKLNHLDSAQRITRIPKEAFKERYAPDLGGVETAETVWENARYMNGMLLTLVGEFSSHFNALTPKAIPSQSVDELEGKPDWRELFGSLDFCQCEHCKSVYGPAAYFVDLLNFLKNAGVKSKKNALEILLSRRPDLTEIELSCENTNTLMPYIDLVNEVLENALAWFNLDDDYSVGNLKDIADKNQGLINDHESHHKKIREKFKQKGYELSLNARLITIREEIQWRILDDKKVYVIINHGRDGITVYHLLNNQTSWTQDELSILPEHLNEHAYLKLSQAVRSSVSFT